MRLLTSLLAGLVLALAASRGSAATLEQVLATLDKTGPSFRDMTASLTRTDYTPVLKETEQSQGLIRMKRPSKGDLRVLVEFKEPNPRSVAFEQSRAEFYYPKLQVVQVWDLGKSRSRVDQFLLLGFGATGQELKRNYTLKLVGAEQVSGESTTRLELIPRSASVLEVLKRAELWIADGGYPMQQKIYTSNAEYTFRYADVKINTGLADEAVRLRLPRNVKREKMQ